MVRKGLVVVHTGDGKGKTTAALGMVSRAVGHGMRVLLVQFVKSVKGTGELRFLKNIDGVTVHTAGLGFLNTPGISREEHKKAAGEALEYSKEKMFSGDFDMVVLDEVLFVVKKKLLSGKTLVEFISSRPDNVHLILTGRGCPQSVIDKADIVTEMRNIKHAFLRGTDAQPGIEF